MSDLPYRGPGQPFPFANHRSMREVMLREIWTERAVLAQWGDPAARSAKARELQARRKALGLSYERLANMAGLWDRDLGHYLRETRRASWATLSLIEQALVRGEAKKGAA